MNMRNLSALLLVGAVFTLGCQKSAAQAPAPSAMTDEQKTVYTLGLLMGRNLQAFNLTPAELEIVKAGVAEAASNPKAEMGGEEMVRKVQELARTRSLAKAEVEKKKGQEFADKAATEPGAQKLPSGLVYTQITEGTGATPGPNDIVKAHYNGTLTDGTVFDSSVKRGQPAEFSLNGVIPCWTEGVQKMKVGGKAKLVCPAAIAYGDSGRPPTIPGGSTLVFEVELLETKAAPAAPVAPPVAPVTKPITPSTQPKK
jgi:FKBP-type peptidyl-prolyl cis-trans isomerase FkpA